MFGLDLVPMIIRNLIGDIGIQQKILVVSYFTIIIENEMHEPRVGQEILSFYFLKVLYTSSII